MFENAALWVFAEVEFVALIHVAENRECAKEIKTVPPS